MPLVGLHVECGYAGGPGLQQIDIPTNGQLLWSQTLSAPGQTIYSVPGPDIRLGAPILSLRASSDLFFSLGSAPDPVNGFGRLLRGGQGIEVFPKTGDFLAWAPAILASGVFISCGYAGGQGFGQNEQVLLGELAWSQPLAAAGPSTFVTPAKSHIRGNPILSISTPATNDVQTGTEIFYSVGLPGRVDATKDPRRYLGAGEDTDIFVEPGQVFAWVVG